MITALYALAAVMIIGGCAAVIQGFPYVRLETGLAMVIAGSVAASGGAVVFGLAVLAARLRRIERAFDTRRIVDAVAAVEARSVPGAAPEPSVPKSDVLRPVLPPVPSVAPPVLPEVRGVGEKVEPSFRGSDAAPVDGTGREPELPGLALEAKPAAEAASGRDGGPAEAPAPDDGLFADGGAPAAEPRRTEPESDPVLRPGFDADPAPPPSPEAPVEAAPPGRTIVGRHASGGNTYVMFDDGSIEAETPRGRFTFASLDELKAFVNAGGEDGARGAA